MTHKADSHPLINDEALRRRLVNLARYWLAHEELAEDLVQETWLRTAEGFPDLSADGRQAWLLTVLRHLCIDARRRQERHKAALEHLVASGDENETQYTPEALADQAQRVEQALHHLVSSLPADDVAIVLLHDFFGYRHTELGALAGCSEAASRQQLHRARQRMRRSTPIRKLEHDDAVCLVALCQLALARHDPAGLVAVLRTARPHALALYLPTADKGAEATLASRTPQTRWVQFGDMMALLTVTGGFIACLPLNESNDQALAA
ncbi:MULTISPECIES: RNA polymerase sigma factor [unclassified Stenotrophomonas]|uniref:RNA polymerase sigma factor n=1 Tax=unclassified Stenotrophomonas TaxID=196198 RepID=UPI000D165899|nr:MULTISPECIES: RNA polymerase sigma factor [unclassified Stenotrophomonas]PTA70676.1 RNA polymerase sigma factor [Stenotrophomonas sp. Nf1]PTA81257.1 RNA polymerase sigma factor [Stenotrophomonas sp. Nf4]